MSNTNSIKINNNSNNIMEDEDVNFPHILPCMRCQPIIDYTSIQYNSLNNLCPLNLFTDPEWRFGTFNLHIRSEIPITNKHLHLFFSIDNSGSMTDICVDGKSKIQHIHFTLENMIRIFHENQNCNISIHVQSFNTNIETHIQDVSNIKNENLDFILNKIKQITPGSSTNIELALTSAFQQISEYKIHNPDHEVIHLFLTDGEITIGNKDKDYLKTIIPFNCTNIFIGYGLEHDSLLLSSFGNLKNNDYRFIDALEKAGLIYGEIIHEILYKAIADVTLYSHGCEIYNFKTNTWSNELYIGNLVSEQKKTYHIRSKTIETGYISVHGKTIIQTKQFQILSEEIEEQTVCYPCLALLITNLNTFVFRQRTQELLYDAQQYSKKSKRKNINKYNLSRNLSRNLYNFTDSEDTIDPNLEYKFEKNTIKTKLIDFRTLMLQYIENNNLDTDPIMLMLCDDIYICIRTLGTSVGNMFTYARQTSQGRQQTYACSTINYNDINSSNHVLVPKLNRQTNNRELINDDSNDDPNDDPNDDFGLLSQNTLTPYYSSGVINLMREVSGDNTIDTQKNN